MTREETKSILSVLKAGYPNFYKDLKPNDANQIIDLWSKMFADESPRIVVEAVKALMCTLVYPPTIADVKAKISLIMQPDRMTEMEAWSKVLAAIKNANYQAVQCFDNLPMTIQKIVGSPNQLREWAMMDSETVNSVIQSNFMRSFTVRQKQEVERARLPESTRELIQSLAEGFSMDRGLLTDGNK